MATNVFKNSGVAVLATSTDLYTCPVSTAAVIHALYLSNIDGINPANVTIKVYDSSVTTEYTVGLNLPVPAQSTLVLDKPINLEDGDIIRITASVAGDIEAFASILEIS